jgi:hypothetical protein
LSWTSDDPAVCLVLDLIAAEHGVASAPRGRFLVAAFPGIQPAVSTARRLQWALTGFAETDRFAATAAAVLVHSTPDLPALEADSSALLPLESAAPGQILLTAKAAELLHDLPGLPLQAATDAGLCELLWRSSGDASSRSADEEAVSRFMQQNGLENAASAPPQQPAIPLVEPLPAQSDRDSSTLPDAMDQDTVKFGRSELHAFASSPRGKLRWPFVFAGAAAVLLVLVAIVAVHHRGAARRPAAAAQQASSIAAPPPASSTAAPPAVPGAGAAQSGPDSSAAQSGPVPSAGLPAVAPIVVPPAQTLPASPAPSASAAIAAGPAKPSEPAPKVRKHEPAQTSATAARGAKPQANPPKAAAAANCDLDSNMLPKMLDQAERNRQQGNYPAALRQFRAVLACDRNNARARSGLDMTELAMQH